MPLWQHYTDKMKKSPLADLNNVSSSPGAVYHILFCFLRYATFHSEVGDVSEYALPFLSGMLYLVSSGFRGCFGLCSSVFFRYALFGFIRISGMFRDMLFRFYPVCYSWFPPEVGDFPGFALPFLSGMLKFGFIRIR
jgi:hypothetical protein